MTRAARSLTFGLLVSTVAVSGLVLGMGRDESESAAIARIADRHARSGREGACAGRPGVEVWLVVTCGQGTERRVYRVSKGGRTVEPDPDGT